MKLGARGHFKIVRRYLGKRVWGLLLLLFLLVAANSLKLMFPQIIRDYIDFAINKVTPGKLHSLALLYLIIAIMQQAVVFLAALLSEGLGWSATNELRGNLSSKCLHLDAEFHNSHRAGELVEVVDGDASILMNYFSKCLVALLGNALWIAGIIFLLFKESVIIGLVLLCYVFVATYLFNRIQSIAVPYWKAIRKASAKLYGSINEYIEVSEDIRMNGAKSYVLGKFVKQLNDWLPLRRKAIIMGYSTFMTTLLLHGISNTAALLIGALLLGSGKTTIGTVYLFYSYANTLAKPINEIREQFVDLQKVGSSLERIKALEDTEFLVTEGVASLDAGKPFDISVENLSFSYDAKKTTLSNVSFSLEDGQVLGVIGRSGSGKTSLAKVMSRLYNHEGQVKYSGQSLSSLTFKSIRENISYVSQEVQIFYGTVRDNIALFRSISDEEILDTIQLIGLLPWFNTLKDGLDTVIHSDMRNLSVGEAQLISIARAMISDPRLIILDEASANLDAISEKTMHRALQALSKNRTSIIIAHKLETLSYVDKILVLESGEVIEQGDKNVLAANPESIYSQLLQNKMKEIFE